MTRRRKRDRYRWYAVAVASVFVYGAIVTSLHVIGWLFLTAVIAGITYRAGNRKRPVSRPEVQRARALTATAMLGGKRVVSVATDGITCREPTYSEIRQDVASGLANLGWTVRDTKAPIEHAIRTVRDSGQPVTVPTVLREVLRAADKSKRAAS